MKRVIKRLALVVAIALTAAGGAVAQDGERRGLLGEWKSEFANPMYGFAFTVISLNSEFDGELGTSEMVVPGIDLRIATGTNVALRGGFYNGIEVGLQAFFVPDDEADVAALTPSSEPTQAYLDGYFGHVFVLAKYGYRFDIGIGIIGASVGAEIGVGGRIASSNVVVVMNGIPNATDDEVYYYVERPFPSETTLDYVFDAGLEGAVRFGRNFRIVARGGLTVTPQFFARSDHSAYFAAGDKGPSAINSMLDAQAWAAQWSLLSLPYIGSMRVGFILNY